MVRHVAFQRKPPRIVIDAVNHANDVRDGNQGVRLRQIVSLQQRRFSVYTDYAMYDWSSVAAASQHYFASACAFMVCERAYTHQGTIRNARQHAGSSRAAPQARSGINQLLSHLCELAARDC